MLIRDEIAALARGGVVPVAGQSSADAAWAQWRRDGAAAVLADVDRLVAGAPASACPDLMALFVPGGAAAQRFAAGLMTAPVLAALGQSPLSAFNVTYTATAGVALLGLGGDERARLMLTLTEGALCPGLQPGQTMMFEPALIDEIVLAGTAGATVVTVASEAGPGALALQRQRVTLAPGMVLRHDGLLFDRFEGQLVTLRLRRTIAGGAPVREIDLDSGRIIHTASTDVEDSRRELMVTLLGRMGRRDAAPVLARLAQGQGTPTLRWQALRECLGLDTAAGFIALTAIARASDDPLAGHAGALRAQLIETHPALETIACPA